MDFLPSKFDVLRTSYNVQKEEWSVDELISILTQEEQTRKKGKAHVVQLTCHKDGDNKKKLLKGKSSKSQFKKKRRNKAGPSSIQETGENTKIKPKFTGKCRFCDIVVYKQSGCYKFKNLVDVPSNTWWLDTRASIHVTNSLQEFQTRRKPNKGELVIIVGNEVNV